MADRPIIFSAPMVRALLDGRKTQTRRLVRDAPKFEGRNCHPTLTGFRFVGHCGSPSLPCRVPYAVGDRLYVREAHALVPASAYRMSDGVEQVINPADPHEAAIYALGWERSKPTRWRPSIHMPRWSSRLTLIAEDVRVERLRAISEADAIAEGLGGGDLDGLDPRGWYRGLWNSLHGPESWDANPFVVAVTFRVIRANIDQVTP